MAQPNSQTTKQARALRAKKQKILIFSKIGSAINVVVLLLCFLPFVGIYNTDMPGIEIQVNGWNALFCGLSGNYTATGAIYGNMDIFNYYAEEACHGLGLWGMIAMLVLVAALAVTLAAAIGKQPVLCVCAFVLNLAGFVLLILAYRSGMAVAQSNIIEVYCQNNPACSVESYATIPAVLMLVCTVLHGIAAVKALKLKK